MNTLTLFARDAQVLTNKVYTEPSLKIVHVKGTIFVGEIEKTETSLRMKQS